MGQNNFALFLTFLFICMIDYLSGSSLYRVWYISRAFWRYKKRLLYSNTFLVLFFNFFNYPETDKDNYIFGETP